MFRAPGDGLGGEAAVGEYDRDVGSVDLPCGAVDLLQDTDADCGSPVSVPAVLVLDGSDAPHGIDGAYVAGVVASTAKLLCLAAVPSHQVPYDELERAVVQSVQLRDPHPQSAGTHTLPLGPLPCLLQPQR